MTEVCDNDAAYLRTLVARSYRDRAKGRKDLIVKHGDAADTSRNDAALRHCAGVYERLGGDPDALARTAGPACTSPFGARAGRIASNGADFRVFTDGYGRYCVLVHVGGDATGWHPNRVGDDVAVAWLREDRSVPLWSDLRPGELDWVPSSRLFPCGHLDDENVAHVDRVL